MLEFHFYTPLKWLSSFINGNLIICSKILGSQGGSRFCRVSIYNLKDPLSEREYRMMTIIMQRALQVRVPGGEPPAAHSKFSPRVRTNQALYFCFLHTASGGTGQFSACRFCSTSEAKENTLRDKIQGHPSGSRWALTLHSIIPEMTAWIKRQLNSWLMLLLNNCHPVNNLKTPKCLW